MKQTIQSYRTPAHIALSLFFMYCASTWQSCSRADDDPCNDESTGTYAQGNTYKELDTTYLQYFPYGEKRKQIRFLYSNDTVTNDTIVYELTQSQYVDTTIGGSGISNCDTIFTEIIRHQYKCVTPKYADIPNASEFGFIVAYDGESYLLSFSDFIDEDWWQIQIGADLYDSKHPNYFVDSVVFVDAYFDVYVDEEPNHFSWYNSEYGFFRIKLRENKRKNYTLQILPGK